MNSSIKSFLQTYVRSVIEEKLDTLIPISHQPRDLIQQIITDASLKFPEFSSSVRKRIRTYLKSYRRSKRVKDMQAAAAIAQQYGSPNGVSVKVSSVLCIVYRHSHCSH